MINLIKNEFIKIFSKKSIYIFLGIMLLFVILTNCIYKYSLDETGNIKENNIEKTINTTIEELNKTNVNSKEYIDLKTKLDINELIKKYGIDSWQAYIINNYMYELIYESNIENNIVNNEYKKIIIRFNNNDWKSFVKEELNNTKNNIDKEILNYRLKNNISYENNYLNRALIKYRESLYYLSNNTLKDYNYYLNKSNSEINKYILDNKININKINDTRGILLNLFNEYEIILIAIIVMISGIIISEEFNKGTIKKLLIKPFNRREILLSKYITSILIIIFTILILIIMQLIVGGIFFGYESLSIKEVIYNFNINKIETYNVFIYLLIITLNKLPMLIILTTFTFLIGVLFTNSALAISLGLILYMISNVINNIAIYLNILILKFFITPNWDLSIYLFGMLPENKNININYSILICVIYIIIMLFTSFIVFNRKNIKNV